MPIKSGVVENIKPSKMRSFSKSMMTKIAQMQAETTTKSKKSPRAMDIKQNAAIQSEVPLDNSTAQEYNQIQDNIFNKETVQSSLTRGQHTNNEGGGVNNARQKSEAETNIQGRAEAHTARGNEESLSKDGNGRGVPKESERISIETFKFEQRRLKATKKAFSNEAFTTPKEGSVEAEEIEKLINEYGIEAYVVKSSAWNRKAEAFTRHGRVYIKEGIDETYRDVVAVHEATHVMKTSQFKPYLDFVEHTPDAMKMHANDARFIITNLSEHTQIDLFNIDAQQQNRLYDEINATVYGYYSGGHMTGEFREMFERAFYDLTTYINELSSIHEQFKRQNKQANIKNDNENAYNKADQQQENIVASESSKTNVANEEYEFDSLATDKQKRRTSSPDSEWDVQAVRENYEEYAVSLQDITDVISQLFDVHISVRNVGKDASGKYNTRTKGISINEAKDIPTIAHELGHHLANVYGYFKRGAKVFTADDIELFKRIVPAEVSGLLNFGCKLRQDVI